MCSNAFTILASFFVFVPKKIHIYALLRVPVNPWGVAIMLITDMAFGKNHFDIHGLAMRTVKVFYH